MYNTLVAVFMHVFVMLYIFFLRFESFLDGKSMS